MTGSKENILFLCNEKFLSNAYPEGGVKFCTDEFIALLETSFAVVKFPVRYHSGIGYRLRKKLGIDSYDDYMPSIYIEEITRIAKQKNIDKIFLNLTNTAPFARALKAALPGVKIILCSHGNESGDFLHDVVMHPNFTGIRKQLALHRLGQMLAKESIMRNYIDLVLTVSEVEEGIEKWLGVEKVFMVPRHIAGVRKPYNPVQGRVGFFSDLSHAPNYHGILEVCKILKSHDTKGLSIRLSGGGQERGENLVRHFPFVTYLGYLEEQELMNETGSWTFALNPVLYYSRGVSTKLGKSLGMGLPVITTDKGLRGYKWRTGEIPVATSAKEMASMILNLAFDWEKQNYYHNEVYKIQDSAFSYEEIISEVRKLI